MNEPTEIGKNNDFLYIGQNFISDTTAVSEVSN